MIVNKPLYTTGSVLIFMWLMFRTTQPIVLTLEHPYKICSINNLSSWEYFRVQPDKVNYAFGSTTPEDHLEITFNHLINSLDFVDTSPVIKCKTNIPSDILYKARNITLVISTNQAINLDLTIQKKLSGPLWQPITIHADKLNKPIVLSQPLSPFYLPKFNWLSGNFDSVVFYFENYDFSKNLTFDIYDIYLE